MNEESARKDWDGPLPAIWVFDLATHIEVSLCVGRAVAQLGLDPFC